MLVYNFGRNQIVRVCSEIFPLYVVITYVETAAVRGADVGKGDGEGEGEKNIENESFT